MSAKPKNVEVTIALVDGSISLTVGDKVHIPVEFWRYATELVNKTASEPKPIWKVPPTTAESAKNITGTIKGLGALGDTDRQIFAGIETDDDILTPEFGADISYMSRYDCCKTKRSVLIPVEYIARHCSDGAIKKATSESYDPVNKGLGLIVADCEDDDTRHIEETFHTMNYSVYDCDPNSLNLSEIVTDNCCCLLCYVSVTSSSGIDKLINDVGKCKLLSGKPKIFFIRSGKYSIPQLGSETPDIFIARVDPQCDLEFVAVLREMLLDNASSCDFSTMTEKLSVVLSMFLPHPDCCWEATSTLTKKLILLSEKESLNYGVILQRALEEGYITTRWTKVTVAGPPKCGRSSLINLLADNSTPVDSSQISVDMFLADKDPSQPWEKIDYLLLKKKIAETLKRQHTEIKPKQEIDGVSDAHQSVRHKGRRMSQSKKPPFLRSSSFVAQDIVNLLPEVDKSNAICTKHWIYVIDSEGQASFLNIAPALQRYNSVNILIHKLGESFDNKAVFYYTINEEEAIAEEERRQLTNLQYLEASFRSLISVVPSALPQSSFVGDVNFEPEDDEYNLVVVGTYVNESEKGKLDETNKKLSSDLKPLSDQIIRYRTSGTKIIFPVNLTGKDSETFRVIKSLRGKVHQHYIEAKVPVRWFLLQLDLDQHRSSGRMVIEKSKCVEFGKKLLMEEKEVVAALKYYHDLTIFLYFPEVLSDVVFLHPQAFISKLSQLVTISFEEGADRLDDLADDDTNIEIPKNAHSNLKDKGIFQKELLNCFPNDKFNNIFTADNFIALMKHLCIIAHLPKSDHHAYEEYFFPYVLPTASQTDPDFLKVNENFLKSEPLALSWDTQTLKMKPLPQGLFNSLVVNLVSENFSKQKLKFYLELASEKVKQYSNAIRMTCEGIAGGILLIDSIYWLEIYYSGRNPTNYVLIKDVISKEVDKVTNKYKSLLSKEKVYCFLCDCKQKTKGQRPGHLCRWNKEDRKSATCCSDSSLTIDLKKNQLLWFNQNEERPQLKDLMDLLGEVAPQYGDIGTFLNVDMKRLGLDSRNSHVQNLRLTLDNWLEFGNSRQSPVTWENIIGVVEKHISFELAEKMRNSK